MTELKLTGEPLSIDDVVDVARRGASVSLDGSALAKINAAREVVERVVSEDRVVYGVTTGFGALANVRVAAEDLEEMQAALLRSHAAGVGDPLPDEVVRAMLVIRARTLSAGHSGVRPEVVQMMVDFLNKGLNPVVPEQGSVGASGDLAQLAHLSLPMIGEGLASYEGEVLDGAEALARAGLKPLKLSFKEGISLLNGTEGMLAVGCLAMADAEMLASTADTVCAMSVDALLGTDAAFQPRLHEIRPHKGQLTSAARLTKLLSGSEILESHRDSGHIVQDAYSIRCAPQVHGAVIDVLDFARRTFEVELGSVTDNPLVFSDGEVLSSGNFHGEPLGFALDFMAAALAELASISERRTDRMLDPHHSNGLPPFLAEHAGTNSGFMLTQYTQAALVAENRILSTPATVDTIPTSGTQEDHVSMGWNAALKLRRVVTNVARVLAVEALCAAQGIDFRAPLQPGEGVESARSAIRSRVPRMDVDRALTPDIEAVVDAVLAGELVADEPSVN